MNSRAWRGGDGPAEKLARLGVIACSKDLRAIRAVRDWYRSGAETYSYVFDVSSRVRGADVTQRCWLKACVALGSGGVGSIASQWLQRRALLEQFPGSTPRLFAAYKATVLEEDIRLSLTDAYRAGTSRTRVALLRSAGVLVGRLACWGFPVLDLSDLRSRGADAVVVDFGSDLGPPGLASRDQVEVLAQVLSVFERARQPLAREELMALDAGYSEGVRDIEGLAR